MGNPPVGAGPNRMRNNRIGGRLIPMLDHGHDVHQAGLRSSFVTDHFDEANDLVTEKRRDKDAAVEVGGFFAAHRFEIFPVVAERPSLADRALVVYLPYSLNERVIEGNLPNDDSLLLGLLGLIPGLEAELLVPPVVEGGYREGGKVVPLHRVTIFGLGFLHPLHECEKVDAGSGLAQAIEHRLRIVQKVIFFRVQTGDPNEASVDPDFPVTYLHTLLSLARALFAEQP